MTLNSTTILIVFSLCGLMVSSSDRPVDCRKFVFAPLCRGVAAKRGSSENDRILPAVYINAKILKELIKNFHVEKNIPQTYSDEDEESSFKKFQHRRGDKVYKLLKESKKINNESGDVSAQEYENL